MGVMGLVGYLSFRNGQRTVIDLTRQLQTEITLRIEGRLETYLSTSHLINEVNRDLFTQGQLDLDNVSQLEKHAWRQIQQFHQTSVYFGSPDGIFVGAGQEGDKITLSYANSATADQVFETYGTNAVGDRTDLLSEVPHYDLWQRPWYKTAIAHTTESAWGEPYVWAAPYPKLVLPAVLSIYTPEFRGVFAVDISLESLSHFLHKLKVGKTGKTFILDQNGILIANSGETSSFTEQGGKITRLAGVDSTDPLISATSFYLKQHFAEQGEVKLRNSLQFFYGGQRQLLRANRYQDEYGLDWLIVVVIPETDFMAKIHANARKIIFLCVIALVLVLVVGIWTSRWVLTPILTLSDVAEKLAQGDWQQEIPNDRADELGRLTQAIAEMADQLQADFDQLEQRVEERTLQLAKSNQELVMAKEEAEIANEAKSTFLAQMSHELRTPLNAILGFVQILQRSPNLDAEQQENLDIMRRSGEHLLGLINNVLDLSKIEAGEMTIQPTPTNIPQICGDLESFFRPQTQRKNLTFQVNYPADLPQSIAVDAQKLRQILINLLNNAIKFTDQGSVSLTLRELSRQGHYISLQFAIADTGKGITEADQAKLFQPFQQSQTGLEIQEGTGLGLVISQEFIRLMGSNINLASQVGQGSTFTFDLRLKMLEDKAIAAKGHTIISPAPDQMSYKLLIVDDSAVNRLLFKKLLAPFAFELKEARDGVEAIALWQSWQPDLIFMDMLMPVLDGEQAVQQIRALPKGDQVTIIACTASIEGERANAMVAAGCEDLISKPFRTEDLFRLLEKYLGVCFLYSTAAAIAPASSEISPENDENNGLNKGLK
jgi:signal transduction histidine kinase/CheY-like chemotaxis protein